MFNDDLIDAGNSAGLQPKTRNALLDLMKDLPRRVELNSRIKNLDTYQFNVPDDARLEKIIGSQSSILKINWLEKALKASKAVCRWYAPTGRWGPVFYPRTDMFIRITTSSARRRWCGRRGLNSIMNWIKRGGQEPDGVQPRSCRIGTSTPDLLDLRASK